MAVIVLFIVLVIIILIIKFFLKPLFFEPKLGLVELLEVLDNKGEALIEKKMISKKEMKNSSFYVKNDFSKNMLYTESYYHIETYDDSSKLNKYYILTLKKSNNLFGKRNIELVETSGFNKK